MMKRGVFASQMNEAERLFKNVHLLKERNQSIKYASYSASEFRRLTYLATWEKCYKERIYDFLLLDDSLIQLRGTSFSPLNVSYAYYECPYKATASVDDYMQQERLLRECDVDEYELLREYEFLRPEIKDAVTPLRYDYSPDQYESGIHPASHVHFGHGSRIRVGTRRILRPLSFALLVIRQCYPDEWREVINQATAHTLCRNVSESLDEVDSAFRQKADTWELTLS